MKRKLKFIIFSLVFFSIASWLWFELCFLEGNALTFWQELVKAGEENEVVIIFNPGGWGTTPFDEALDFAPIVENIKSTIENFGYKTAVVPYFRTKNNFFAKIGSVNEFFTSFHSQSKKMAQNLEGLIKEDENLDILMVGLSSGATFVNETVDKLSEDAKESVLAIGMGLPFWNKSTNSPNALFLDKQGKDPLSSGNIPMLIFALIKSPFHPKIEGHFYFWEDVEDEITVFCQKNIKR
ncbi:MAG: hypothetical protein CO144_00440 [Candidatus Nealsonbacteria bacterium CG_4_9_14_3_um_filter_35_11]|uniref:Uncharacterized protein n=2 Tax=Candidatus Nealsoniibacteriota TaxID=1817911 RepID=A0A2M7DAH7_9BACT|nr:MAG: hypothetical protein COV62_02260 [Candidatus Nealsonbacteria bacterium CG11_big_fil_rev_8_21_14_0_20_35_11]PIV45468.1 MAG: hypothetical protein COS24_02210 [Candidatus Nealsonbacteria bacterium CG02_land_8_20_14_3_00_34_20]PIW92472.1 MAG: hypothetical protein COZ88_02130 [Candidatus Nealsonbacteria bacterium CG_4_8_14_3_um_filter_34_13]PIZ89743.1 MAG: hypothetical protein COX88_02095 [Candidatus Nealsonbacteria bacterium CG_4_10_14_0_2_um_filter_35_20]PJA84815.1 MAG: hypothetical protei